jgi:eukaryotic-like serine/threonine-protein kinase
MTTPPNPAPTLPALPAQPTSADWAEVRACFERAVPLNAAEREALFADAHWRPAVVAEVRSLLVHEVTTDTQNTAGFLAHAAHIDKAIETGREGQRLGAWLITERLGQGGMGDVWLAQRADGAYTGQAAVKVLKRGMDSAAVLARFALEQQSLARLQHPHIAHLLDAGRTPDGLPYFVMERVLGQPIDKACEGLTLEARLQLFLQLAHAVAHAHRNLLVHRDLKPSNVMVTPQGQVKLLDFGIAKALDPLAMGDGGAAEVALTQQGMRPYTPQYASPEQVRGEPVNTATDIYSLGVLLYQLLTGTRPTGRQASTPAEVARSVLEETPTKPSRLSAAQTLDPQWLTTRKKLEGDLDNILLKALEKSTERRYVSVDALAADVRAYVCGYPVAARPAGAGYRISKWVGRNRLATVALALGGLGVLGGLAASRWQAHQATLARDDAKRQLADVKQIASELVFRFGDVIAQLPGGATVQEALLKQTVASLDVALARAPQDPELVVLVAQALGRLAQLQGNPSFSGPERAAIADATVARALALADQAWPNNQADWRFVSQHVITLLTQAQLLRERGQVAAGLKALDLGAQRAGQSLAQLLPDVGRATLLELRANVWTNIAHFNDHAGRPSLGQPEAALKAFDQSEADFLALYGNAQLAAALDQQATAGEPPTEQWRRHNLANVHAGRAVVYQKIDDPSAMRREVQLALPLREQNVIASPTNVTWRQGLMFDSNTLSIALLRLNEPALALRASQRAWDLAGELTRESPGANPWTHVRANFSPHHGRALAAAGRHGDALLAFDLGLARLTQQRQGIDSPLLQQRQASLQVHRAKSMLALGQHDAAVTLLGAARAQLDSLVAHATMGRDARLARANATLAMTDAQAAAASGAAPSAATKATTKATTTATPSAVYCELRRQAFDDLQAAAGIRPLAPDALALRSGLVAVGSCGVGP